MFSIQFAPQFTEKSEITSFLNTKFVLSNNKFILTTSWSDIVWSSRILIPLCLNCMLVFIFNDRLIIHFRVIILTQLKVVYHSRNPQARQKKKFYVKCWDFILILVVLQEYVENCHRGVHYFFRVGMFVVGQLQIGTKFIQN
jgi:hypothetical protein